MLSSLYPMPQSICKHILQKSVHNLGLMRVRASAMPNYRQMRYNFNLHGMGYKTKMIHRVDNSDSLIAE